MVTGEPEEQIDPGTIFVFENSYVADSAWELSGTEYPNDVGNVQYKLVLTETSDIEISLESQTDTFLMLLNSEFELIIDDDDGGTDENSFISDSLTAGTYYIEAATYYGYETDNFELIITSDNFESMSFSFYRVIQESETVEIYNTTAVLSSDSNYFLYELIITEQTAVQISLSVPEGDAYLYLLSDSFDVIYTNDDAHEETDDSRIYYLLNAGTYYIDASAYIDNESAAFEFTVATDNLSSTVSFYEEGDWEIFYI
ncbi:MAG: hypothetical protein HRU38_05705 [Saccharospirillaceae bacterium]|nr:hypothetical protein [Pseudomonadales bacterium]NRB78151.1 hypothetical protein [Saccharospirillaceae bacterium]